MIKERLLKTVLLPHFSEKATLALSKNAYVFRVTHEATKPVIKAAVQHLFNVTVENVRVVCLKPKKKMFKGTKGVRRMIKKAYVTLAAGQSIDLSNVQSS